MKKTEGLMTEHTVAVVLIRAYGNLRNVEAYE